MLGKLRDWIRIHARYDQCASTLMSAICSTVTIIFSDSSRSSGPCLPQPLSNLVVDFRCAIDFQVMREATRLGFDYFLPARGSVSSLEENA